MVCVGANGIILGNDEVDMLRSGSQSVFPFLSPPCLVGESFRFYDNRGTMMAREKDRHA
ncbi:hypothetical protein [Pasteuria penetrans]|uniref:hypothetical protein n=1 Tax=Pasteuria penetrans TaxID=86005 RepID=UPI000F9F15F2|nr:hypothetical protein [Pasteuria penetrans]